MPPSPYVHVVAVAIAVPIPITVAVAVTIPIAVTVAITVAVAITITITITIAITITVPIAITSSDCRGCSERGRKEQGRRRGIGHCDGRCGSNGGSRPLDHGNGEKIFLDDRLAS